MHCANDNFDQGSGDQYNNKDGIMHEYFKREGQDDKVIIF